MELSSRADNVQIVRQAIAGLADAVSLSPADLNDVGTAVTEACNNVSMHAYDGVEGPLKVELLADGAIVVATVRDWGAGLRLHVDPHAQFPTDVDGELAGLGMPSIQSLATRAHWRDPDDGGTDVEMVFSTGSAAAASRLDHLLPEPCAIEPGRLSDAIEVGIAPPAVARNVLPRLLRAMAARAHFSMDEHAGVQRVGEVLLADDSPWATSGGIQVRLVAGGDSLELTVGPLSASDADALAESICRAEPSLQTHMAELDDGARRLAVRLRRARASAGVD